MGYEIEFSINHAVDINADSQSKGTPISRETADHSLPYILVAALTEGNVWLDDFSDEIVHNPELHVLMQKIEIRRDEGYTRAYPEANCFRLELSPHSDETLVRGSRYAKGHPKNPMIDQEIETKFRKRAEPVWARNASAQFWIDFGTSIK